MHTATSPLDPKHASSTFVAMSVEEQLRAQDWRRISALATKLAQKITRSRSMDRSRDLAQQAITQAFERKGGWDPAKEPVEKFLARTIVGLSRNEWRRKHTTFELHLTDEVRDLVPAEADSPEVIVGRRRLTAALYARMSERLAGDGSGTIILTLFVEGVETAADQAAASALPIEEIRRARRRVFEHAEKAARELGMEEVAS